MVRPTVIAAALAAFVVAMLASAAPAAEFHVDPNRGRDDGDGSRARPFRSLRGLFDKGKIASRTWASLPYKPGTALVPRNAGAPIRGGDTILLHGGDYGNLEIIGYYNDEPITLAAAPGERPRFRHVLLRSDANWVLRGLHVSPEFGPADAKRPRTLVELASHGHSGPIRDVTLEDCEVFSARDTSKWSKDDWNRLSCSGVGVGGTRMTVRGNRLRNVSFGISVGASHSLVERNTVENFAGDGLRGLGDYTVFQYNVVKNCYAVNANHDDGFQSWSAGPKGVGTGKVVGIVLRGNTIINYEDPDQPHRGTLQGIGCFDGMFEDWVIENNVVIVDHWHGITLMGAINCRIVNNTVIDQNTARPGPPWIRFDKHKNGTPSTGCVIRNNLAPSIQVPAGQKAMADHNIAVKDPAAFFVNPAAFDLRLRPGCAAIDAGSSDLAPKTDAAGTARPQGKGIDVGAYEWSASAKEPPDRRSRPR